MTPEALWKDNELTEREAPRRTLTISATCSASPSRATRTITVSNAAPKKRSAPDQPLQRPAWLDLAHKGLDKTVAAAYDWTDNSADMADDENLRRLLALNLERVAR